MNREFLKQIYTKALLVFLLVIQCAFLGFTLFSAPETNGHLRGAISNLRNSSQSNIARLDQNEAREIRATLEGLASNQKFNTTITLLFSFVSLVLIAILIIPLKFVRVTTEPEGDLRFR